ncbi:MAG: helix-turn-helix transcriptional regulator [Candidatus Doudnabacteria bacterium]|nr:helix-turn-helix transcriptional regulator [Candidatus Doudnabacteria bacterium]
MSKSTFSYEYKMLLAKIKSARASAGMTQGEAAKKLGRNQSFLSKVESGERRLDVVELAELMRVYGAPMDMMLSDILRVDKPPKKKKLK